MRIAIASIGPASQKVAVVGAVMEHLIEQGLAPQFFRPIEVSWATTFSQYDRLTDGIAPKDILGNPDKGIAEIVERFHAADPKGPVVIVGTDFAESANPIEFSLNARVATNLGAEVVMVLGANDRPIDAIIEVVQAAVVDASRLHATVRAVVVTSVRDEDAADLQEALRNMPCVIDGLCPEDLFISVITRSQASAKVTPQSFAAAIHGFIVNEVCDNPIAPVRLVPAVENLNGVIAAMQQGDVIVTGSDRTDIALGALLMSRMHPTRCPAAVIMVGSTPIEEHAKTAFDTVATQPGCIPVIAVPEPSHVVLTRAHIFLDQELAYGTRLSAGDVAKHLDIGELMARMSGATVVTPLILAQQLLTRSIQMDNHIVLPEGNDTRILVAADDVLRRGIAKLTILGDAKDIAAQANTIGLDLSKATIIDPAASPWVNEFAERLFELRQHKGMTMDKARELVVTNQYFGCLMVESGKADGMVSGAATTTADVLRPALQVVRTKPNMKTVSSVFLIALSNRVLVFGDCAVNPEPSSEALADIALSSVETANAFGIDPKVAMLSYSSGDSGTGESVEKVREATRLVRERDPSVLVDGPLQFDTAIDETVGRSKLPDSPVAGEATVFIFPDLNTGNNTYKAVQRIAGALAVGPVLQGLNRPVNDLSRGATVPDIINTIAITAIQAG